MKSAIINIIIFVLLSINTFAQMSGFVREITFLGEKTQKPVSFSIYLPEGYVTEQKAYPVVYHLHGLGDNYRSNSIPSVVYSFERAMELGFIDDVIIVFPDGYNNSMWGNSIDGTKPAETNLIEELLPFVDANFKTIPDREHRFIQGFSMGGFGAAKFIAKYPELFGRAIIYDGGMRTWQTLRRGRPEIVDEIFKKDENHFIANSPWKYLRDNWTILSLDTLFYISVGDFKSFNQTFFDSLNYHLIPYKFAIAPCGHDLECLLEREWINAAEFYSACMVLHTDVFVSRHKRSTLSLSPNPVSDMLSINYTISRVGKVRIDIVNMMGSTVHYIVDSYKTTGNHRVNLSIAELGLTKGTYFVSLMAPEGQLIKKLVVIK